MKAQRGDKVRLKTGTHRGQRGVVLDIEKDALTVQLDEVNLVVRAAPDQITNYSLAARKAWVTGPDRQVGRRKGTRLCDRVSVTLRIDRDLWEDFVAKEASGAIDDRTTVINAWLREKLATVTNEGDETHA